MEEAEAKLIELRATVAQLDAKLYKKVVERGMRLMIEANEPEMETNGNYCDVKNDGDDASDKKSVSLHYARFTFWSPKCINTIMGALDSCHYHGKSKQSNPSNDYTVQNLRVGPGHDIETKLCWADHCLLGHSS